MYNLLTCPLPADRDKPDKKLAAKKRFLLFAALKFEHQKTHTESD
jgi:hypothetical protein